MTVPATVTSDAPAAPLTVAAAAREVREAWFRVGMHARSYEDIRVRTWSAATTQARGEWGLACLEWAAATVAHQAALDRDRAAVRHDLAPDGQAQHSAGESAGQAEELTAAEPQEALRAARSRLDTCQRSYEQTRTGSDPETTRQARNAWERALTGWILATLACKAAEDEEHLARHRRSQIAATKLRPDDAFPRDRTREQEIAHASRERARRAAIERDQHRYDRPRPGT